MVAADGRLVRADDETEPDLFWAVRGGGGSFGVVTAIEIELFPAPELYAGALFWPVERAADVIGAWREWTRTVPDEVTSVGRVLHLPPIPDIPEPLRGGSFAVVEAVFTGSESHGAELLAPLRALEPSMDTFAAVPPPALTHLHMDPETPVPGAGNGMFLDELPAEALEAFVGVAVPPLLSVEIRHLGGALTKPLAGHGAVGAIGAEFVMYAVGLTPTPDSYAAVDQAVERVTAALAPWESARTYFGLAERRLDPARFYPAETYERLCRIRAAYDPAELFVSNHPIPAARQEPR
jgi:FAD/FMN-containing dehydrogenase